MTRNQKMSAISAGVFFSLIAISSLYQYFTLKNHLKACSLYTLANIKNVYRSRGITRIEYVYNLNNNIIKKIGSIGFDDNIETTKLGLIDRQKLKNRNRLMVQVYCSDLKQHQILWDIKVPDTLTYIPVNGWKEIPYGLAAK